MAQTVEYQGYTIQSVPQYLTEWEKWRLRIFISVDDHLGIRSREFSSEVLYKTEREAEIHGIAFGQRLIDGKVAGRSIADMKTTDRRATPRLPVHFRTTFSDAPKLEGTGSMLDLSTGGCRIESTVIVEPGMSLELRIYVPHVVWRLLIEAATVQWVSGHTFGLAFFRITETERLRLDQILTNESEGRDAREEPRGTQYRQKGRVPSDLDH
jgi:PilZ domain